MLFERFVYEDNAIFGPSADAMSAHANPVV